MKKEVKCPSNFNKSGFSNAQAVNQSQATHLIKPLNCSSSLSSPSSASISSSSSSSGSSSASISNSSSSSSSGGSIGLSCSSSSISGSSSSISALQVQYQAVHLVQAQVDHQNQDQVVHQLNLLSSTSSSKLNRCSGSSGSLVKAKVHSFSVPILVRYYILSFTWSDILCCPSLTAGGRGDLLSSSNYQTQRSLSTPSSYQAQTSIQLQTVHQIKFKI
ncbi:hypothetical protein ACTA71_009415 [Dictyostelium dimigraforme]